MDEISSQIILSKISTQLNDYKKHADDYIKLLNKTEIKSSKSKYFAQNIFQRNYSLLVAVSKLIESLSFFRQQFFVLSQLFRTLLHDYIILEYIYNELDEKNSIEHALSKVNSKMAKKSHAIWAKDKDTKFRDFLASMFPENLSVKGENLALQKTKELNLDDIASYLSTKKYPYALDAYKIYQQYSIYSHYSNITPNSNNLNITIELKMLINTLFFVFNGHDKLFDLIDLYPKSAANIVNKQTYFLDMLKEVSNNH